LSGILYAQLGWFSKQAVPEASPEVEPKTVMEGRE